jgi:hypothetical protein
MASFWTYPNLLSQSAETDAEEIHIPWGNLTAGYTRTTDKSSIVTSKNLYHIARSPKHNLMTKTYFLKVSGFRFENLPVTLSGIELRINGNRRGRIMDDTIALMMDNQPLGENKATSEIPMTAIYGSPTDTWRAELTIDDISNPNFGVMLRYKSHNKWPHSDPMLINSIELRIY